MAKKVLIVDDIAFVRKTLAEILREGGYQVVGEASDGREAVEKWTELRPDVVTMDVVMPNLSGIDATKEILKRDKQAIVVMISAMDQIHLVMEAINAGAKDYIQKPFHSGDIHQVISRALRGESNPEAPATLAPRAG
ncbi:MAG: response regulator [Bdellovibrionales bacterium]|nr:response regulator [Bdellovibrionales bacterium]